MKAKKGLSKSKRVIISAVAAVCALSSVAAITAGAVSSECPINLQNGGKHSLSINLGSTSGTSNFSITSGAPCEIKNSLSALEYTSSGSYVRTVTNNAATAQCTSRVCTVSRKSGTSNKLKNYNGIGYNYSSTAKYRFGGNSYFNAVEIGDHGIELRVINP